MRNRFVNEVAFFAGTATECGMMIARPGLLDHVAKEVARYTGILNYVFNVREELRA